MPSKISICNQALLKLGANQITDIDQEGTEAAICKAFYDDTLGTVLDEYPWTFATKRYELPKSAETPPKPFSAQYLIPSNIVRIIEASSDPNFEKTNTTHWVSEDGYIRSDSGSMFIRVISNVTDPNKFTPGFVRAFVLRLASEMCTAISHSRELQAQLMQEYSVILERAVSADSQVGRPRRYRSDELIDVRIAGTSFAGPTV